MCFQQKKSKEKRIHILNIMCDPIFLLFSIIFSTFMFTFLLLFLLWLLFITFFRIWLVRRLTSTSFLLRLFLLFTTIPLGFCIWIRTWGWICRWRTRRFWMFWRSYFFVRGNGGCCSWSRRFFNFFNFFRIMTMTAGRRWSVSRAGWSISASSFASVVFVGIVPKNEENCEKLKKISKKIRKIT